ncbi:MAG: amino acid adenylation domain-containing protein [Verrucomicrobiales bacterium]
MFGSGPSRGLRPRPAAADAADADRVWPADFQLVWTFHHALLDGRSMPAILRDAFALYADPDAALPSPARGFGDFARWMADQDFSGSDGFWAEQLGSFTAPTPVAIDSLGPDRGESDAVFRGEREISLSPTLTSLLDRIAKANGWTMNTILQGAWGIVLARYAGADDVVFGATRACRKSALGGDPAAAEIVGLLINTVPVRAKAGGCTKIADYLTALRGQWLAMRPHEHTPLSRAQAQSGVALDRPLFDTLVVYENGDLNDAMRALGGGAWDALAVQLYERTNFPITLAGYGGRRLRLKIEFDRARLSGAAIERMLGHLETILRGIAANPGNKIKSLDLLTDRERQGLPAPSAERRFESPLTLHAQFEQRVAESPDAVAATCGADRLTYAALNRRANQLAKALVDLGVKPGDFVGLCVERSLNVPASVLGILKAGAAYLPVDLAYPQDRLAFMLEDANAPILVTQRSLADQLPAHRARLLFLDDFPEAGDACDANIDGGAAADDLAYCIYTSGSTGRPKGVMVTHQNVNRLMRATDAWFGFGAGDVWTLFHSYAFDFSVWEIWGALLYGGRLVVVPYLVSREPRAFYELVAEEGVTVLNQTPSAFRQFIKAEEDGARDLALRYVIFGGEALEMRSLQPWFDRHGDAEPQLVNMYGITETTVHVTYRPLRQSDLAGGSVIGIPIPDLQIYILDPHGNPLPEGVPGEMFVGGAGLARGYLNRPELTAERFIKHPFAGGEGERLYRTGDVARLLPGGDLEYLGRCDDQVKIRGFRIELGEIESVLCEHPAIREACVIAREDAPGEKRLAAYYVAAAAGAEPSVAGLREHLLHKLPDYMVPAAFVAMPDFPLTENGKINRRALPAPGSDRADLGREFAAPRTDAEMALAAIWAEVLRVDRIGIHDKFFELGGDSILLIQIVSKARAKGIPISARDVFQKQTIAELAKGEAPGAEPQPVTVAKAQPLDVPLTPIQQWFFEQNFPEPHFYNQAFLFDVAEPLDTALLQGALDAVADHHPIFRARFEKRDDQWRAIYANGLPIADVPLSIIPLPSDPAEFERICAAEQSRFDLNSGNLLHATYFEPADDSAGGKLFLAAHHLAIDGVTWAIMLQDLEAAYRGEPLPSRTDTVARWAQALQRYAAEPQTAAQVPYWQSVTRGAPSLAPDPANTEGAAKTLTFALDAAETEALLRAVPATIDARPHEAMIGALAGALRGFFGDQPAVIETEGHGREGIIDSDISRTAGWFTSIFPLRLDGIDGAPADAAQRAAQLIRAVPDNGIGYGVLRYLEKSLDAAQPRVLFNFLGQFDQVLAGSKLFAFAPERSGAWHGPSNRRRHELEINTMIRGGQLRIEWTFCPNLWDDADASRAAESFAANLREIIAASRATPATSEPETYALAPLQELYFTLESARPNAGFDQWHFRLRGNVDAAALERAWRHTIARHPILRTTFAEEAGAPVQSVQPDAALTWQQRDWRGESDPGARFAAFLREDAAEGFSLADGPLTRITLIQLGEADYRFVWSHHHLQIDGWSWPLILRDVRAAYGAILRGDSPALPPAIPYRRFIDWLESRDESASVTYWKSELDGFADPTLLPGAPSASNAFAEIDDALTEEESRSLATAARTLGVTPNALAQLAWAAVLAKMSGSNDVVFGASFSGRPADLDGVGEIVGPFVNNLPVRVEF